MYQKLRRVATDDTNRVGVSEHELIECGIRLSEHDAQTCLGYLERFTDIVEPNRSAGDSRPDWVWISDSETVADHATDEKTEETTA